MPQVLFRGVNEANQRQRMVSRATLIENERAGSAPCPPKFIKAIARSLVEQPIPELAADDCAKDRGNPEQPNLR